MSSWLGKSDQKTIGLHLIRYHIIRADHWSLSDPFERVIVLSFEIIHKELLNPSRFVLVIDVFIRVEGDCAEPVTHSEGLPIG